MVSEAATTSRAADAASLRWAERSALFAPPDHKAGADAVARRHRAAATGIWGTAVPLIVLIALVTAARIAWLILASPYDLIEDEAHYWLWSRHLDLSYYSKGPGIAFAIRGATEVFGASEWAVRLPAVLASAIAIFAVGAMVADIGRTEPNPPLYPDGTPRRARWAWRPGLYAAICFALAPINQAPAFLATIDGPYIACWALACWAAWRAFERRSRVAWFAAALAIGVGFLFKYTILLLLPGLLIYFLARPDKRTPRGSLDLLIGSSIVLILVTLPVFIWNWQHGWPTARHLLGHLGVAGGDVPASTTAEPFSITKQLLSVAEFIGSQLAMVGPALILVVPAIFWAARTRGDQDYDAGAAFLICCGAPILVFYLIVAFFAEAEGNWAMGGYVTLLALAGWYASDELPRYRALIRKWRSEGKPERQGFIRRQPETLGQVLWHSAIVYGLIAGLGMLWLEPISRAPYIGPYIPIGRITGFKERANHAAAHAARLEAETGQEPFFMTKHYGIASQLSFYLPGRPHALAASAHFGGRPTQFDFWPETDLSRPDLIGRPAVLVGGAEEAWSTMFERVENLGPLDQEHKEGRNAYLGYGYRGPPPPAPPEPPTQAQPTGLSPEHDLIPTSRPLRYRLPFPPYEETGS